VQEKKKLVYLVDRDSEFATGEELSLKRMRRRGVGLVEVMYEGCRRSSKSTQIEIMVKILNM